MIILFPPAADVINWQVLSRKVRNVWRNYVFYEILWVRWKNKILSLLF